MATETGTSIVGMDLFSKSVVFIPGYFDEPPSPCYHRRMIGQSISHYEILEKLGEGGMGVVYKAEDSRLARTVALKFLPPHLYADENAKKRFIREAKTASALDHSNIIAIHEIDETPDGRMFIVMAYYEGRTLRQMLDDGPLEIDEALDVAIQIAEGLAAAHDKGILHRDIKPGNILVTKEREVKILDFGLAKLAGRTKVTSTGTRVGTISYMSPEQVTGGEVDHRSDIFSLGVVLHELLTGEPLYKGDNEAAAVYGIVHSDPKPASSSRSDIPAEFQRIIDKSLSKAVGERYQSAHELWDDLARLAGDSTRRPPRRRPFRLRAGMRRSVGFGLLGLVLVATLWGLYHYGGMGPEARDYAVAVVDFRGLEAAADPTISAGMKELINIGLVESSPIRVVSPEYLYDLRRRLFGEHRGPIEGDQALEISRKSGATLLLAGSMGRVGDEQFVTWRLVDTRSGESVGAKRVRGGTLTVLADQIIAGVLPLIASECGVEATEPVPVDRLTTSSPQAYRHYTAGVLLRDQARDFEAVAEFENAARLDTTFGLAYFGLARAYGGAHIQNASKAREYGDKAWRLRARLGIKDRLRLEAFRADLDDQLSEAIATYKETLQRWPDDRETLRILVERLANHWSNDQVAAIAHDGLAVYPDDPIIGGTAYLHSLEATGRTQEALRATHVYVKRNPANPNAWDELGRRYLTVGYPDSAESAYRKAVELDPTWYPEAFAYCAYHAGDLDRAMNILEEILARADLLPAERVRLMIKNMFNPHLGALYREAGRYERALEICEATRRYISNPRSLRSNELRMSGLLLAMGKPQEVLNKTRKLAGTPTAHWLRVGLQGSAMVALGDLEGARSAARELYDMENRSGAKARSLALKVEAEIALAENRPEDALDALQEMRRQGVIFGGFYDIGHREATARAFRMAHQLDEAARTLQELTRIYGGHALGRYELGQVYEEMSRPADAEREFAKFLDMWSKADEGLPQLADARQRLIALRGDSE